ncbi:cupin domain-containing protein [Treponema pectinovorum]|uniref:cupin domain-containing protein n=1 Tax=Treponema pectinovorum TaxID=164 RepID=UPI0011CC0EE3|nr:cupin domain-containing protein [Treponema pectinovorum]
MTPLQNKEKSDSTVAKKKIPYHFGEKIRAVRERKGLTLKAVALDAGVSESLVSQIERNKVSPAIDTLLTLADVLDINLEFLFEEYHKERPVEVTHKNERRKIKEGEIIYEEIVSPPKTDNQNYSLESYEITIPVKEQTHRGSYGHLGREIGYILEGKCILQYENLTYELEAGDSVSFSASSPHTLINAGSIPLKAIWVVTPPQRFVH